MRTQAGNLDYAVIGCRLSRGPPRMPKLFIPLLLLYFLPLTASAMEPPKLLNGTVIEISDGNTIAVKSDGTDIRIRLFGIDAPEIQSSKGKDGKRPRLGQPHGEEARTALAKKLLNRTVQLEVLDVDRKKRPVAIVRLDGRDINLEMLAEGHAWVYRKYLDTRHSPAYLNAEENARMTKLGLWAQKDPHPPWEFRRLVKDLFVDGL